MDRLTGLLQELGQAIQRALQSSPEIQALVQKIQAEGSQVSVQMVTGNAVDLSQRAPAGDGAFDEDDREFLHRLGIAPD